MVLKLLPNFSDFLNSDDCIGKKTHQNLSDYIQFLLRKKIEFSKKGIISSEQIRNSGNYIYDYAHSFFGKDF